MRGALRTLLRAAALIGAILKELSDENAYARYLRLNGVQHSAEQWRRFSDARLRARFVRPKCC